MLISPKSSKVVIKGRQVGIRNTYLNLYNAIIEPRDCNQSMKKNCWNLHSLLTGIVHKRLKNVVLINIKMCYKTKCNLSPWRIVFRLPTVEHIFYYIDGRHNPLQNRDICTSNIPKEL